MGIVLGLLLIIGFVLLYFFIAGKIFPPKEKDMPLPPKLPPIPHLRLVADISATDRPDFNITIQASNLSDGIDRLIRQSVDPYRRQGIFSGIKARVFLRGILIATSHDPDLLTWRVLVTQSEFEKILHAEHARTQQD